jgi:hypothetical protein
MYSFEKRLRKMKEVKRIYLYKARPHNTFSCKDIFYNNSKVFYQSLNIGFHAVNQKIKEQYQLLRSPLRHVKVCVPLITDYVEELRT